MSASSSDSECDLCYNNYRDYTPIQPLYPDLGHPLIYYAQVQRKQRPQKSGRKNNCFVKAFRWYTEEHVPLKNVESGTKNDDAQGFAAWLDQKYDEYTRKSQITQIISSQYILKPTSSVRSKKVTQNVVNKTSVARKRRMKSPWRRRKKYLNRQNGDTMKKSNQSIEFILNPKNLSRSTSECCQKCHRSDNANMIDRSLKSKSESIIYILKEQEMFVIPSDHKDIVIDKKNCKDDRLNVNNGQVNKPVNGQVNKPVNGQVNKQVNKPDKDMYCQCSIVKIGKMDASSQFSHTKTSNECGCVASYTYANERINNINTGSSPESQPGIYQKVLIEEPNASLPTDHPSAMSQKNIPNTHSAIVPRETSFFANKNVGKNERSFSVNGIAQTSNHAINLSQIISPERVNQIFFKIICVDE